MPNVKTIISNHNKSELNKPEQTYGACTKPAPVPMGHPRLPLFDVFVSKDLPPPQLF